MEQLGRAPDDLGEFLPPLGCGVHPARGQHRSENLPLPAKNFNNVPVSKFHLIRNGFTESMPANTTGLDAEAADDVWLNDYNIKVMIWVDNHGQRPSGQVIGHATS